MKISRANAFFVSVLALSFSTACGTPSTTKVSCLSDQDKATLKTARDAWYPKVREWRTEVLQVAIEMRQLQQYPHWLEMADWFKAENGRRYVEQRTQQPWDHYPARLYWFHRWEKNGPEVYDRTWDLVRRGVELKYKKREMLSDEAGTFHTLELKSAKCPGLSRGEEAKSLEMWLYVRNMDNKQLEPDELAIINQFLVVTGFCPVGCAELPASQH